MENLLLVFDEIDDVFSTVGLVWRPIASFLAAIALFVATGFVFLTFPVATEVLAISLVSVGLLEMLRQRRREQAAIGRSAMNADTTEFGGAKDPR